MTRRLTIERMGAQGDGVAADGTFAPFTLPGETVEAKVAGGRAEGVEVLAASLERQVPPCAHFGVCGGCALQHWQAEPYLAWKRAQVVAALSREGLEAEVAETAPTPAGSRRRLALHARRRKGGAAIGFKSRRSWDLVEISECPIADPRLVAAFPALARLAEPFLEHPKSAPTLHVTLTETGLDIDVTGVERKSGGLSADARMRAAEAAQAADFARVTMAGETVYQVRQAVVALGPARVALPPGAFLQAAPQAEAAMAEAVLAAVRGSARVADLYCGVGTFTFRLAREAEVLAADSDVGAIAALRSAAVPAGLKAIHAEARDLVRRPVLAAELKRVDAVVFDPPRAGAAEQAAQIAASSVARVAAVSCNPATFARDARILADAGFRLTRVLPVDQFLWSPHIELVGVLER